MMPTCTALMPVDRKGRRAWRRCRAFTLTELIVAVVLIALFVQLAVIHVAGLLTRSTFKAQAQELVSTMQMAASAAAESNRRYEVTIDLAEQRYTLREITTPDLWQVLEEEIIIDNDFGDNCRAAYVLFDDLVETSEEYQVAHFRAGHSGWQYGGKIVLLDEDDRPYSVVISRLNRIVTLKEGDVELLLPRREDEIPF